MSQKHLVSCTVLVTAALFFFIAHDAMTQDTDKKEDAPAHHTGKEHHFKVEFQRGAEPKLVPIETDMSYMRLSDDFLASFNTDEAVHLTADCETDPTPSSGIRRDCDSDPQVVNVPTGYYFVEADASAHWLIDRGTDNRYYVEWHNRVEIYPGTRVYVPTTVKFWVHARGPSGPNSGTGRSKVRLDAPFKKLPPTQ